MHMKSIDSKDPVNKIVWWIIAAFGFASSALLVLINVATGYRLSQWSNPACVILLVVAIVSTAMVIRIRLSRHDPN